MNVPMEIKASIWFVLMVWVLGLSAVGLAYLAKLLGVN